MSAILEELFSIEGKTALGTGGAKGVGAMISRALVRAGADVIIVGRSAVEGEDFVKGLDGPGTARFLANDLTTIDGVRRAAADVARHAPALHILVNNAGTFSAGPIEDTDPDRWDSEMGLNLRAPFFLEIGRAHV